VQGDARNALQNAKADLVVVGARGHSGLSGLLLGSVADYISKHSDVPVVIVPTKK
jgi:nucleotide-binding universal stress UspA family protein